MQCQETKIFYYQAQLIFEICRAIPDFRPEFLYLLFIFVIHESFVYLQEGYLDCQVIWERILFYNLDRFC